MPIDPAELAASIGTLYKLDLDRGLGPTLQQVVDAAKVLVGADGAGLMLADTDGRLRWASALQPARPERRGPAGTCRARPLHGGVHPAHARPCRSLTSAKGQTATGCGRCSARPTWWPLSVPVELEGGPIGTLDVYSAKPDDWDNSEVSALQAYARVVASLLGAAVAANVEGRLAEQLQAALDHRLLIEQAKAS